MQYAVAMNIVPIDVGPCAQEGMISSILLIPIILGFIAGTI